MMDGWFFKRIDSIQTVVFLLENSWRCVFSTTRVSRLLHEFFPFRCGFPQAIPNQRTLTNGRRTPRGLDRNVQRKLQGFQGAVLQGIGKDGGPLSQRTPSWEIPDYKYHGAHTVRGTPFLVPWVLKSFGNSWCLEDHPNLYKPWSEFGHFIRGYVAVFRGRKRSPWLLTMYP